MLDFSLGLFGQASRCLALHVTFPLEIKRYHTYVANTDRSCIAVSDMSGH